MKPIKLTEELKEQAIAEFSEALDKTKMSDGKVSYTKSFVYTEQEKAHILFTQIAYTKMLALLSNFSSEIGWYGAVKRESDNVFVVTDIMVYPQEVTGTTVEIDQERLGKWYTDNQTDERLDLLYLHGHSHVDMATSPSGTDIDHQLKILANIPDNKFYIFMIWNKKLQHYTRIFDLKNNALYENDEIEYGFYDNGENITEFIEDAKSMVVKVTPTYNYQGYNGGYGGYSGYIGDYYNSQNKKSEDKKPEKKSEPKPAKMGSGWKGRGTSKSKKDGKDYYK